MNLTLFKGPVALEISLVTGT